MKIKNLHIIVTLLVVSSVCNAYAQSQFISINYPGATSTIPYSINDKGQIVGSWDDTENFAGFLYDNGIFTLIAYPGASQTYPSSINNVGQVVVTWSIPFIYVPSNQGFLYEEGTFKHLDYGTGSTLPHSINDEGQIVGDQGSTGFIYTDDTVTLIAYPGAKRTYCKNVNNKGQVVGDANSTGFLYEKGNFTLIDYPGAIATRCSFINNMGQIVGRWFDADSWHGFLYEDGNFTSIDYPGAIEIFPSSINNVGQVVGHWRDADYHYHGFLYEEATFIPIDYPESTNTYITSINDEGQIVGYPNFLFHSNVYVSSNGDCGTKTSCFSKIQDAIDNAYTGSAILVKQGIYAETLSLGTVKTLLIKGGYNDAYDRQTANTTFIDAPGPTTIKASSGSLKFQMINIK